MRDGEEEEGNMAVAVVLMSFLILIHREAGCTSCPRMPVVIG